MQLNKVFEHIVIAKNTQLGFISIEADWPLGPEL